MVHGGAIKLLDLIIGSVRIHATVLQQKPVERLVFGIIEYMYYVYILSCSDQKFYIGYTQDLKKRIAKHKNGEVTATKPRRPVKLIFYEAYIDKYDALRREKYLKTQKGKTTLKSMLREFLSKS